MVILVFFPIFHPTERFSTMFPACSDFFQPVFLQPFPNQTPAAPYEVCAARVAPSSCWTSCNPTLRHSGPGRQQAPSWPVISTTLGPCCRWTMRQDGVMMMWMGWSWDRGHIMLRLYVCCLDFTFVGYLKFQSGSIFILYLLDRFAVPLHVGLIYSTYSAFKFTIPCGRTLFFGSSGHLLVFAGEIAVTSPFQVEQTHFYIFLLIFVVEHPHVLVIRPHMFSLFLTKNLAHPSSFPGDFSMFFQPFRGLGSLPASHPLARKFWGFWRRSCCLQLCRPSATPRRGKIWRFWHSRSNIGRYQQNMEISTNFIILTSELALQANKTGGTTLPGFIV